MTIEIIKAPELPESVESGSLLSIHAKTGDYIEKDQLLFEIETDKIVLEVCATASGTLTNIGANEGDEILANHALAKIDTSTQAPKAQEKTTEAPKESALKAVLTNTQKPTPSASSADTSQNDAHLSPAMRQQLRAGKTPVGVQKISTRAVRRVKMTRIRQKIANHLLDAQKNAAILSTFNEVNMNPVMDIRAQYKDRFLERHDTKLGFMSFFTKACAHALKEFEAVNAYIENDEVVYHDYQDIGVAMSTDRGLIVPVLRNTEDMSFSQIESGIVGFAKKAKSNALALSDLEGGTFTITNGGIFGSLLSTPILNPPQSAILGMHAINQKPWVENNEVVIRSVMMLALSYDHRIIDGKEAVLFLRTVKELIEDPIQLLLEI